MTATAFTLADYAAGAEESGDFLTAGVMDTLRKESFLLDMLPFPNQGALKAKGLRIKSLPTIQNRKVNNSYSHSVGTTEPLEEDGYLFGGKVQMDHIYKDAKGGIITDPEAFQTELYLKALAYQFNYDFFNNLPGTNPDSIVGLRYRFPRDFSAQIINGGGVDISPDATTLSANFNTLYDALQSAIYACEGHTCDMLAMNSTTLLRVSSGLRQLGLLSTAQDSFGRNFTTWGVGGPMLVDMGNKGDQTTKIFTDTEGATGIIGGGTLTSIMALKFGPEYLTGWQLKPMQTWKYNVGPINYVEMDWYAGLFISNPRSLAWLYNIQAI